MSRDRIQDAALATAVVASQMFIAIAAAKDSPVEMAFGVALGVGALWTGLRMLAREVVQ